MLFFLGAPRAIDGKKLPITFGMDTEDMLGEYEVQSIVHLDG